MGSPPAEAVELKNKGNDAFKKQDWPTAIEFYTKAIEAYDQEPSFYTNRAQVRDEGGNGDVARTTDFADCSPV